MYKLIKINNARANVPEPVSVRLTAEASAKRAMPVIIADGTLTVASGASETLPTHVTLAPVSGKVALCYELTPEAVLEVAVDGDPKAMTVGTEYLLSSDGERVSTTKASGTKRGATLISKDGASVDGDTVLVRFR